MGDQTGEGPQEWLMDNSNTEDEQSSKLRAHTIGAYRVRCRPRAR